MKKKSIFIILLLILAICYCFRQKSWQECLSDENEIIVKDEILDTYIIQGVCQAKEYTLVTAYNTETPLKYSIVMIYNEDGSLYNIIQLDDYTHAGAIAYYNGLVYISGIGLQYGDSGYQYIDGSNPNEALIEVYSFNEFLNADSYLQVISRVSTIYFGDHDSILFSSASARGNSLFSSLTIANINNELCIIGSNYNTDNNAHLLIIPFKTINENGIIDNQQISIYDLPVNRAQGICAINDTTFLITQTNGDEQANLNHCIISGSSLKVTGRMKIPPHAEQVSWKDSDTLIISFEMSDPAMHCFNYKKLKFSIF